jgi:dipeptidyl aminopeptidase/acylaminoacyl peptidase
MDPLIGAVVSHYKVLEPIGAGGIFAPRVTIPVLQLSGRYDYNFPDETSSLPFFKLLGTHADHKRRVVYDTGHNLPPNESIKETLDWFDKYLGPPQ